MMILCEQVIFKGLLVLTVLSLFSPRLLSICSWHLSMHGVVHVIHHGTWWFVLDHLASNLTLFGLQFVLSVQLRFDTALES